MSKIARLDEHQLAVFQALVRAAIDGYGLTYPDVVKHDCRKTEAMVRINRCPCGNFERPPTAQTIRNALRSGHHITHAKAHGVLTLLDRAAKTRRWRQVHKASDDRWMHRIARARAQLVIAAGWAGVREVVATSGERLSSRRRQSVGLPTMFIREVYDE